MPFLGDSLTYGIAGPKSTARCLRNTFNCNDSVVSRYFAAMKNLQGNAYICLSLSLIILLLEEMY